MNATPKDVQGRTPGSSGDADQKLRLDALRLALEFKKDMDEAMVAAHFVATGELPEGLLASYMDEDDKSSGKEDS